MISDLELMEIQVRTLFNHDENGRLLSINSIEDSPAPRFFLGRTKEGNIRRFRNDLPEYVVRKLDDLVSAEPVSTDLRSKPAHFEAFKGILQEHAEIKKVWIGPAYRFPDKVNPPTGVVGITDENLELLKFGFRDAIPELESIEPCMAVVEDGKAVSICCSVRISPEADEAGVETLVNYRRRGYAARVVAGWGIAVRGLGRIPLYSTSWDNLASQGVARKLGLVLYGVDLHFT